MSAVPERILVEYESMESRCVHKFLRSKSSVKSFRSSLSQVFVIFLAIVISVSYLNLQYMRLNQF